MTNTGQAKPHIDVKWENYMYQKIVCHLVVLCSISMLSGCVSLF
ncbi:hypothetical protein HMPREF0201_02189 [Cedecea davisae DSM 4568]|uniref:Uncharacterized protein n=1 Tax=Cedecea davisae DSM 4568 TaxID=566551 RepID=S3JUX5_9ENTR|nr:hypothetical protein HMPREF0201_02189 [Cedecea davisae DSM 4568]